jgi:hypothetical protein
MYALETTEMTHSGSDFTFGYRDREWSEAGRGAVVIWEKRDK